MNQIDNLAFFSLGSVWRLRLGAPLISLQYPILSDQLLSLQEWFFCFMSHNNTRFLRDSVLAEYMPCSLDSAHYSQQENRTKTYSSWDIHDKLLSFHPLHIYTEKSPLGLPNCHGEISQLFHLLQCGLQKHKRRGSTVFCVSSALTCHAFFLCQRHSRYHIAAERRVLFFHTLILSQILFLRPWFCWYQLNTVRAGRHWSRAEISSLRFGYPQ